MHRFRYVLVVTGLLASAVAAQGQTATTQDSTEWGGYRVNQSIELGYRFLDLTGSRATYDTFIDQREGPRLLQQSLSMRSPEHTGVLFDDLTASSFGWGGDPENAARLRISKYKMYDFSGMFRRDQNSFDYNLFANPLNPPTSTPSVPVTFSPHTFAITRRMYDFGLTLLPQSRFTVRLGFSRNRAEGPSFSSFHEGTDVLLNQPWNYTSNEFRVGFDVKVLPATTISYDQFVSFDKNDTNYSLAPFATFTLPNGAPVEFGLPWNTTFGQPCNAPLIGTTANPVCNGYFSYSRVQRVRTTTPTEQLSINSNYFKRVNLVARVSYSSGDLDTPYAEAFNGLVTRTLERQFTFTGPAAVRRVATTSDFGATVQLTDSLKLNESFRLDNWRIPGNWNSVGTATVALGPPSLLAPLGPTVITPANIFTFLGQKSYYNLVEVEYSPSKLFGGRVGYRFRHRNVRHAEPETIVGEGPLEPFEGDDIDVDEHGAVLGAWLRPTDKLRFNFDMEAMYADNFITRISPRQRQNYRMRMNYTATQWATIGLSGNLLEARNGQSDTQYENHYRNAGIVVTLMPNQRVNLDVSYNYTDALQNAFICYNGTFLAPGTIPGACPTFNPAANNNPNWIYSDYSNNTHYFSGSVAVRPIKKLTLNLGYGLVRTDGSTTILNPLQPLATLAYTFHRPTAAASYEVIKNVSLNAYWNYDQYNERSFVGPTLPRYFHSNRTVLSAKYAF